MESRAATGHVEYVSAADLADPWNTLNPALDEDDAAAVEANDLVDACVDGVDPRLTAGIPIAEHGAERIFQRTVRPLSEPPPNFYGGQITMRDRRNAAGTDIEGVIGIRPRWV